MQTHVFYTAGSSAALTYAVQSLKRKGYRFASRPGKHVTHLLLPVPSFDATGLLKGGEDLQALLPYLSNDVTILGGNLPAKENYVDLLKDPEYVAQNADITAHCAVKTALQLLPVTLKGCPVLVIGWGRIGKCLSKLLAHMGAAVTVAARKPQDRAMLLALGYSAADTAGLADTLHSYRVIFNTVPELILDEAATQCCRPDCLKIELASRPGIAGSDVVPATGLPSKKAPETSGELIAGTVLRLVKGV